MDKTTAAANDFSKGTRVGIAGTDSPHRGTVIGPYFSHRDDIVIVHWDHHDADCNLVLNTGNLRVVEAS